MTGLDWSRIDQPLFDRIVDTILGRIHGDRGFAPEGRGGDQGTDYTVDDNAVIYQYKFYPDGANTASRRRQIKRSFVTAMKHNPREWVVVIPAKLLNAMRAYILRLSTDVKITIRDRTWLNNRLIDYPDLAEYFQYRTDVDYLHSRAEALKVNPLFRSPTDISDKTATLKRAIDASDPDWTFDISTIGGDIVQMLRAKDPNAPRRSPIKISYTAAFPMGSAEHEQFELSWKYGIVEPIRLSGSMVQNFKITGPELVAYEGPVDALELLPDPDSASPWANTDMTVTDADAALKGTHLSRSRLLSRGDQGMTIEVRIGGLLRMLFRLPDSEGEDGRVDVTTEDFSGEPIPDVFAVTDFLTQLRRGSTVDFLVNGSRLMRIILRAAADAHWPEHFEETRSIADDLAIIERETKVRFRYPQTLTRLQRVDVRNVRLMLEGHVVAHPTWNQLGARIEGQLDSGLAAFLDGEPRWVKVQTSPGQLKLLNEIIDVPEVAMGGPVHLNQDDIAAIRSAIDNGSAEGLPLTFRLDPDDRLRIWLPDRFKDQILWITPWNLPGIEQPAGTLPAIVSRGVLNETDQAEG
jgi:hypothetical protein